MSKLIFNAEAVAMLLLTFGHVRGVDGARGYEHKVKGCVPGHNIVKHSGLSVEKCADLCNANDKCKAFEYGVAYGGKGSYKPRDCQLQSSAEGEGCDGGHYNLDLYIKPTANGYEYKAKGCVPGHNIVKHSGRSVQECADLCDADDECKAFEYGVAYGGKGSYKARDCQLQSSADAGDCDGGHYNLDLYIKPMGKPSSRQGNWPSKDAKRSTDDICYRDHYSVASKGRGIHTCPNGYEKSGLLCYPKCRKGYYGVGPVCWSYCPEGWRDDGALCNNRGGWTIGSTRNGCPWYDVCGLWHDCTSCPSGTANHGCTCHKTMEVRAKKSYGRGVGKPLQCSGDEVQQGLFCYPKCHNRGSSSYELVGHVCWEKCGGDTPFSYGAACCKDGSTCAKWTATMAGTGVAAVLGGVLAVATAGTAAVALGGVTAVAGSALGAHELVTKSFCDAGGMDMLSNGKCQGNPIKTMSNNTAAQCINACLAYGPCEYVTFESGVNKCYMYRVCDISSRNSKFETFKKV